MPRCSACGREFPEEELTRCGECGKAYCQKCAEKDPDLEELGTCSDCQEEEEEGMEWEMDEEG